MEGAEGSGDGKWIQTLLRGRNKWKKWCGNFTKSSMKEAVMKVNKESSRMISMKVNVDRYPFNVRMHHKWVVMRRKRKISGIFWRI